MFRWQGPWVLWSLGIFYLSSLGRVPSVPLFPVSDKVVHAFTYFILALLTLRAFKHWPREYFRRLCFVWAFIFCILYGASDEWHQLFVPGRTCDVKDWFADAAGAFAALVVYFGFQKMRKAGHEVL